MPARGKGGKPPGEIPKAKLPETPKQTPEEKSITLLRRFLQYSRSMKKNVDPALREKVARLLTFTPETKEAAFQKIRKDPKAVKLITEVLKTGIQTAHELEVKKEYVKILGGIGDRESIRVVQEALLDDNLANVANQALKNIRSRS